MNDLHAAVEFVEDALNTRQIGIPVAVRIVAQEGGLNEATGQLDELALRLAGKWLGDSPAHAVSAASAGGSHQSKLVSFTGGKTALLSTGVGPPNSRLLEIVVIGNHGILSWEAPASRAATSASVAGSRGSTPVRPPQKPPYGILLVAGDHTHQPMYASALLADSRCRLVGLVDESDVTDRRRQLNEQFASRLDIPLLDDMADALERDDVHIVSVCAEPIRRGPIIAQAARAGKHLYLDKPLAGSTAEADDIVAAVRQSNVLAHMFSSVPTASVQRVRRCIESGELGDLLEIHCDFCFAKGLSGTADLTKPRVESPTPERYEVVDSKRELTNVGVYSLVMMLSLLGRRVRRVAATTGNYFFEEHQANDMEDFGQLLLEFEDGLVGTCTTGRTGWRSHPLGGLNRTYLVGTEGSVVVDADLPRVEVWSDSEPWLLPRRNPDDPMGMWVAPDDSPYRPAPKQAWVAPPWLSPGTDVQYFLNCLEQGHVSEVSAEVAADATKVLLAAYRSASTRQAVALP